MGLRYQTQKNSSSSCKFSTIVIFFLILITSILLFLQQPWQWPCPCPCPILPHPRPSKKIPQAGTAIDLRDAKFPWNKLSFGHVSQQWLKLAVFSKTWPVIGAAPGGMERHASTLCTALADRGHEVHVFTVPSDRTPREDIHQGSLHVHFAANDHGSVNCSLAFEIFSRENEGRAFDFVHTESVSLPHWRAKMLPNRVAVTWHGIWYEIMHSKLFQELLSNPNGQLPGPMTELQEAMPRLIDEIRFFSGYTQHICISNSAADILTNIYQAPRKNVHVILNGVDETVFVPNPVAGISFRRKYGVPDNASVIMGVAGRLVRDKGHPLLYEAISSISRRHSGIYLLVAGKRYKELAQSVKVLGALEALELSAFYNALNVFVNPTLRPQGLDLTLIEAMHCGKPVVAPNYPSITGTVLIRDELGYTFSPNVNSLTEALEKVVGDGRTGLRRRGAACKEHAVALFTATKMASAYERFFLCMKDDQYCKYPLPNDL
ncbi:hypothetical protein Nepgr_007435 [Nepenthes gracilis]|uniref:Glycosyltransferase subfamily 4-like N-terminal domain-containing protein n=1 Tax=Nepenthes gracilis TaxID=150966 RepID=A0AAD3XIF3_NEPGR|nr:hypothetical protein Nepgr_007435 [Nepenthes gracilis]